MVQRFFARGIFCESPVLTFQKQCRRLQIYRILLIFEQDELGIHITYSCIFIVMLPTEVVQHSGNVEGADLLYQLDFMIVRQ